MPSYREVTMLRIISCAVAVVAMTTAAAADPKSKCGIFEWTGFTDPITEIVDGTVGFDGLHAECQAAFGPTARLGTSQEYFLTVGHDAPTTDAWVYPILSFVPTNLAAQHCDFWSNGGRIFSPA